VEELQVRGVSKRYGDVTALDDVSFTVPAGQFYALLGSSGSGKTTALRTVAGFVHPDDGTILVGGRDLAPIPVHRRNIGIVFQSYALFQHLSIFDNLAYGLLRRKVPKDEIRARVLRMLELLSIRPLAQRKPEQLSGGQQQRVALGRALVIEPTLLLLDEPLSALDRKIRQELQSMLKDVQRETKVTTLMVTHDQEEALFLADELMVLEGGRMRQVGKPHDVYVNPSDAFVAQFMGESNSWNGTLTAVDEPPAVTVAGVRLPVALDRVPVGSDVGEAPVLVVVRPEHVRVSGGSADGGLEGIIDEIVLAGPVARIRLSRGDLTITALSLAPAVVGLEAGQSVSFSIDPDVIQIFALAPASATTDAAADTADEKGEQ
jgi:ABC-type Fe3+/spermidine/putrescine transport system ATPase subunit